MYSLSLAPAPDACAALVRRALLRAGLPEHGVRKYTQPFADANVRTVDEVLALRYVCPLYMCV